MVRPAKVNFPVQTLPMFRSMKIAKNVVFLTGTLDTGGLERFVTRVCIQAKRQQLFNPMIICLSEKRGLFVKPLEEEGIVIVQAPAGWQRKISGMIALGNIIKHVKADVVHSQVNFSLVQQFLITRWGARIPFLVTERNCYPLSGFSRLRRQLQFYFLKLFGVHYSANSIDVASYLARLVHYPVRKIPVIPNGMDIPQKNPLVRDEIRRMHHWQEEDFVIGYVARFADHKGQEYFVRVMENVYHHLGKRLKICFVGDGPERKAIEDKIQRVGLSEFTTFTGVIDNVESYYQAFDASALLSDYEGMPNVVLEAMAHGLPVVANPVGNVKELMEGDAGIVNYSSASASTAALVIDLALHPAKRIAIGYAAQEQIRKNFSLQSTLQLLTKHYGF